jgi:hypothetical protein
MDPGTAIGLASSVVGLISFAGDLVSKTRQIATSASGITLEHAELETLARNLQRRDRDIRIQTGGNALRGPGRGANQLGGNNESGDGPPTPLVLAGGLLHLLATMRAKWPASYWMLSTS